MTESGSPEASPQVLAEIDRVCDAFEREWTSDTPAQMEACLEQVPAEFRPRLFQELLLIDLQKRRLQKQALPPQKQVLSKFPAFREEVLAVYKQVVGTAAESDLSSTKKKTPHSDANWNLLFGILAMQMDFVSREDLIAATSAWVRDKSQSLDRILVDQGALALDAHALLAPLVEKHLEMHDNDPEKSLASVGSVGTSIRDELARLGDADIEVSLTQLPAHHDATQTFSLGESTSEGQRFRILRPHAKGGLGQVSVARDNELNREVALKEIQDQYAHDPSSRERFVMEAEITGGLEHPGIVPVYGLGQYEDGRPFYAMRFIRGDSLKEAIDRFHGHEPVSYESVEFRKLLGRFVDVCNAIRYAHSRGVLHRDLKPGNIMLGKYGKTLVVDWGLARLHERDEGSKVAGETTLQPSSGSGSAPTQFGSAIGTPAYMPPEQAAGNLDELGPRSDVYSLGATLHHLLTGQPPVTGEDVGQLLKRVQHGDFAAPRTINADVPKPLDAICQRAMATRPKDRYDSPQELADDVECYLADEPVAAHTEPVLLRARRWVRKHPRSVACLTATVLIGLISSIVIAAVVSKANEDLKHANEAERRAMREAEVNARKTESANRQLEKELRLSRAFRLTAESQMARAEWPQRSLLLAVEAVNATLAEDGPAHPRVEQNLRDALQSIGGTPLVGHGDGITALALSAEGKRLVSGSADRMVRVWDLEADDPSASAKVLKYNGIMRVLTLSTDGKRLVTTSAGVTARVWDLEADNPSASAKVLKGHGAPIIALALSANGKRLVTGSLDDKARVWDLEADDPSASTKVLEGHDGTVGALALSTDGKRLVSGSADRTVRVWNLEADDPSASARVLKGHDGTIGALALSKDGKRLVTGSEDRTARVWDLEADDPSASARVLKGYDGSVVTFALSTDGQRLVIGSADDTARMWDLGAHDPNTSATVFTRHDGPIRALALSTDGKRLVTGSNNEARVWDLGADDPSGSAKVLKHSSIRALALSTDGKQLVTGRLDSEDFGARVWDLEADDPSASAKVLKGHDGTVEALALSTDGKWLVTGSLDHTMRVWNLAAADPRGPAKVLEAHGTPGRWTRTRITTTEVVGSDPAKVLEGPTVLERHDAPIRALALSTGGKWLVTGSYNEARVWDLEAHDPSASVKVLKGHDNHIEVLALSADGKRLVTGSFDNTARVWDLGADNPSASAKVLKGHVGPIWALALSTDGKRLVTGSEDGTARVWDLEADDPGASAKVLKGHDGPIRALALSTDGKRLVSGSDDHTVRVWLIELDDLLTVASRVVGRGLTEEEREMYDLED